MFLSTAQRGCRVSIVGDIQILTGLGLGQLALVDSALHRVGLGDLQRPLAGLGDSVISSQLIINIKYHKRKHDFA